MKLKKQLVRREIAGDVVLVPIGTSVYDSNGLFILNETGAFLWDHIESCDTELELSKCLCQQYDVCDQVAKEDVSHFLTQLRTMGIID